jgi:hypothetical protein
MGREAGALGTPKPLMDKLGVKPGMKVTVLRVHDPAFLAELTGRGAKVSRRRGPPADLLFLSAETRADLFRLGSLEHSIVRDGAIWVVFPKGRQDIREVEVIESGVAAGLVDIKVVRFSETHTALKFVIPLSRR